MIFSLLRRVFSFRLPNFHQSVTFCARVGGPSDELSWLRSRSSGANIIARYNIQHMNNVPFDATTLEKWLGSTTSTPVQHLLLRSMLSADARRFTESHLKSFGNLKHHTIREALAKNRDGELLAGVNSWDISFFSVLKIAQQSNQEGIYFDGLYNNNKDLETWQIKPRKQSPSRYSSWARASKHRAISVPQER